MIVLGVFSVFLLKSPDSRQGTPPNRELARRGLVKLMVLAGTSASPDSRRGAPGNARGCVTPTFREAI